MGKAGGTTSPVEQEKLQWLAILNPGIEDIDAQLHLDEQDSDAANGDPSSEPSAAGSSFREDSPPGGPGPGPDLLSTNAVRADSAPGGGGSVKGGGEAEVLTKEIKAYSGKYGKVTGSCTIKVAVSAGAGSSDGFASDSKATLKDKKEGRTPGIKQGFSAKDLGEIDLFKGLSFENVEIGVEGELSGTEVSVAGSFKFDIVTSYFKAPSQLKITLVKVKVGDSIKVAAIELKVAAKEFSFKFHGVETKATAEFKVSFEVDWKKVGIEIIERIAKKKLEKEAEKQGVKLLGREAGELVLRDLGPLAAAFSVGLDIGGLLNEYTVAPKVAQAVDDAILGDLNEQYQKADTLGKMWLLSKNSPKIIAALIASGVAGAVAGIGDLVLFKIMGLPTAKDFEEALKRFQAGIHEMGKIVKLTRDNIQKVGPGSIVYGAIMLGIKTNPKHAICAHGALEKIIAAIYGKLHPLYKPNGINDIISVHVGDASLDPKAVEQFSKFLFDFKKDYASEIDVTSVKTIGDSLKGMLIAEFLSFLERNKLIRYNVKIDGSMDADDIDPKLLDELYAGTPLENLK